MSGVMLITIIVLLNLLLIASIIGNVLLFKNAEYWRFLNEQNENRIIRLKFLSEKVYRDMKELDSKELFQKDDEVGVIFSGMVDIIKWFDEIVQNEEEFELGDPNGVEKE
jgi:hypothetical protein